MFKVKVLLKLFNKSRLRNVTKTFLEPKIYFNVKFQKLGFSAPLNVGIVQLPCFTFSIKG